ncbi:HASPIN protein kinase [Trichophyton rubrum D6]|uniref:non-specific serine/threonine protein kinase n=4 Tax=Trichophyton TaxID=5550 RepID=A0A178F605_TRIRU|nr:HASPIN protein kinase [Trichophyton rubrum CBS 118892]EZF24888.1 HASPIN protein kinase [Trichophyton rubrum MR850]EZF44022.1 HASPIN protein kinase [Trichophyton rubrum CBS 100081]EZF54684.1 HASPIN protein kinase [Trichophyton rubrum CBS 288.86]EZF65261.1 HASPIN protein kinase [Trichophyton rubrum CBS 289.86]EZF86582.1 HASPIN protein kinase [Trichophyton rubrum MR1448]EZF97346.1 HASPIN protein kinase [Trichophyton rubrum MR1459]EZG18890.1 HASPIN protein kinase [Trichophyton rubrum CBS 202.
MVIYIEDPVAEMQADTRQRTTHCQKTRHPSSKATKGVHGTKGTNRERGIVHDGSLAIENELSIASSSPDDSESLMAAVRDQLSQITIKGSSSQTVNGKECYQDPTGGDTHPTNNTSPEKITKKNVTQKADSIESIQRSQDDFSISSKNSEEKEDIKQSRSPVSTRKKGNTKIQQKYVNDKQRTAYVKAILNEAMSTRSSRGIQHFDKWANKAEGFFDVRKIAEGSYGEVYELCAKEGVSKSSLSSDRSSKLQTYMDGVFKIVPLCAQRGPGSKKFTTVDEIVAEVQLLKLLDPIPGFARFREIHVVQGRFPPSYQNAWDIYSRTKDDCFNPDPSKKKSYPDNQLWAILEMENAGFELEKFKFSSVFQVYDVFWGVALALARAEQYASFEHRDLHLGNVCVKQKQPPLDEYQKGMAKMNDSEIELSARLGLSGLETTIIDYSLSRAELSPCETQDTGYINGSVAWSNLEKKEIFDAVGRDEEEKFLRDTYRMMRSEVLHDSDPDAVQWKNYRPRTNLIWLSFILATLVNRCRTEKLLPIDRQPLGQRSVNSNLVPRKPSAKYKVAQDYRTEGQKLRDEIQHVLFERLETVLDLLELEDEYETLSCAGDLVAIAIGSQWLEESDFLC